MKTYLLPLSLLPIAILSSCAPIDGNYAPAYSVYQAPSSNDYEYYHHHDGHHHHHHHRDKRKHYHPNNQWDDIVYRSANKNLSNQDIKNINALSKKKKH